MELSAQAGYTDLMEGDLTVNWALGVETPEDETLSQAELALDQGDAPSAIHLCNQVLARSPNHAGALFIAGGAFRSLRDLTEAEHRYRQAIHFVRKHSPSWSGLASVLFDQLKFKQAHTAALTAIRLYNANSEGYWIRGLVREWHGNDMGAVRDFRRAWRLSGHWYPRPLWLSNDTVRDLLKQVAASLPDPIRHYLSGCTWVIREVPKKNTCRIYDPHAIPTELLCHLSIPTQSPHAVHSILSTTLYVYRRNIQRLFDNKDQLFDQLRSMVFHELHDLLQSSQMHLAD